MYRVQRCSRTVRSHKCVVGELRCRVGGVGGANPILGPLSRAEIDSQVENERANAFQGERWVQFRLWKVVEIGTEVWQSRVRALSHQVKCTHEVYLAVVGASGANLGLATLKVWLEARSLVLATNVREPLNHPPKHPKWLQ